MVEALPTEGLLQKEKVDRGSWNEFYMIDIVEKQINNLSPPAQLQKVTLQGQNCCQAKETCFQ